jgi:predicted alpha-1,2-mannosidase
MQLADMGQYAHGNQPVLHVAYLYNYVGQPWKTQDRVRKIMDKLYSFSEKGYPGDEDQGGMSSWYVLNAMGLYSVTPGTVQYNVGSPLFEKITITSEQGKKFVIEANGNSKENVYIQSAILNGEVYTKNYINYSDISEGGILSFKMGDKPAKQRGTSESDKPFSVSTTLK